VARPARPLTPGAVYHVSARGNRKAPLFLDDADRVRFVRSLARVADRLGWSCLAWCVMTTHYHLLVLTPEPDLAVGMHRLNGDHAQYFNVRHGLSGHVFQGRYHSVLATSYSQLLVTARYIALNPVSAGLCGRAAAYRWSSHRAALDLEPPIALDRAALLARFAADGGEGCRRYADFVDGTQPPPTTARAAPACHPATPLPELLHARDDADTIATAYLEHGYSTAEIAAALGVGETTVRRRLRARLPTPAGA